MIVDRRARGEDSCAHGDQKKIGVRILKFDYDYITDPDTQLASRLD